MLCNIFDSHAHYDDPRFDADREQLIGALAAHGVTNVINVGTDLTDSQTAIDYAARYHGFYAAVGIHPHEAEKVDCDYIDRLRELAVKPRVVAIGEIGLDYYYEFSNRTVQKRVFEHQLKLAQELDMPVIIHAREATADTLQLLQTYPVRGVVHCFSGSAETAKTLVEMGFYLGFTGVVTFKNAKKPAEAAAVVPLDRLLLETDCPYMAPTPFRGQRCDSTMIAQTAAHIATIKGIDAQTLIDHATQNTKTLFGI